MLVTDFFLDTCCNSEKSVLDLQSLGFKTLRACGKYDSSKANPPLQPAVARNSLILCYLERGHQLYLINGRRVELRGGQVMRIFPGDTYGTGNLPVHRGTLYWITVAVDPVTRASGAMGMSQNAAAALMNKLLDRTSPRVQTASSMMGALFERIFHLHAHQTAFEIALLRHLLVLVLLEAVSVRDVAVPPTRLAAEVARHLVEDPSYMPNSEELAGYAGLSVSTFYDRFGKETGITPKEFVMRWKMGEALKRLKAGDPVTYVAHALGFSSSQYFASVVRQHSGKPPSHWRKRHQLSEQFA